MSTSATMDGLFELTELQGDSLAAAFGTPLYVVDERTFRERIREYIAAFRSAWPNCQLTYASKANSALAVLAIAAQEGCTIDVASEGEFRAALAAGIPAGKCQLHGNNKSSQLLRFAIEQGVREIIVDNQRELELIVELGGACPELLLRLSPAVNPLTDPKISTGHRESKFGFSIGDDAAQNAVAFCHSAGLPLAGFHCHVGSQLLEPSAQIQAARTVAEFALRMARDQGFSARVLNIGGGRGIQYRPGEVPIPINEYCAAIAEAVRDALSGSALDPVLVQEPGRALIGPAGVTLYRIGTRKRQASTEYLIVDGGLSDNPRPVMYGGTNMVRPVTSKSGRPQQFVIAGSHCETDTLFTDVELPNDLGPGDLIQVLGTGAYNASMASNYNRFPRPATVLLREDGSVALIQSRETWEQVLSREVVPHDLEAK
ncbi:MAG: diaminopimelate decarboxylase [Chthonomonas sp.]|nr:diaminopimelate decarboxylase [Chthonomonas sp.]